MRDLSHNIAFVTALSPAVQAATATSAALDVLGFNGAAFVVNTGAIVGAGDFTPKIQHSDTTTSGDFVDVPAIELTGSFPVILAADTPYKCGYIGNRRYVRLVFTKNGGTSIAAGALLVKNKASSRPVA
jgi:hypothetical protein